MSDEQGKLLLHLGDDTYDLNTVALGLAVARDFATGMDIQFAAKNRSAVVIPSPLTKLLDEGLEILRHMATNHSEPVEPESDATPAVEA